MEPEAVLLNPDGTIMVERIETRVGTGQFFDQAGVEKAGQTVVVDVYGRELGSATAGSVTLVVPMERMVGWLEHVQGLIQEAAAVMAASSAAPARCTYYEENVPGLALMDSNPPHRRCCPRCDATVVPADGNWRHAEDDVA